MPVFVVGLNHRSAPLDLLERLAIDPERRPKALAMLLEREHVKEGAILSTCNRVEVYAAIDRFHDGGDAIRGFLTEFHGISSHELSDFLYAHYEDRAVNHLFAVSAGIDSMVVGEVQILGQVRESFQAAQAERTVGPVLHALFTQALRVGRRARHETAIGQGLASTLSVSLRTWPPSWAAAGSRWGRSTRSWPPPTWWSLPPRRSSPRSRSRRSVVGSTGGGRAARWSCWTSASRATSSPRSASSQE